MNKYELIHLLHEGDYSLTIYNGEVHTFRGQGVSDLYRLINDEADLLRGAMLADKVAGKAAAALMMLGGVKEVFANVISQPALNLLDIGDIHVSYGKLVPYIINRSQTGWCPLETRCYGCHTPNDCLQQINEFFKLQTIR